VSPEPELITVVRRLADLEQQDELGAGELGELNRLRRELDRWPEVNAALAVAYVAVSST
jgi:hypothetical protein